MAEEKPSGLAVASLVTGICSLFPLFGTGPGIAAFICGIMDLARIKSKQSSARGKSFDITGIVLGSISIVLFIILLSIGILEIWYDIF
jgi:hypothetical protein